MIIILDACTVINLLLIDEDGYLLSCLDCFDRKITETVFTEIRNNLKYIQKQTKEVITLDDDDEVERKLSVVRSWQELSINLNEDIEIFEKVFKYKAKKNGEFYSSILALRLKQKEGSKVIFYTDDYVAKNDFLEHFLWNQIGYIEDTVELLTFLYTIFPDFGDRRYERFLSKIKSRYSTQITGFINSLRNYEKNLPAAKIRKIRPKLTQIIDNLENLNFNNIENLRDELLREDKETLNVIFKQYKDIFESQNEQGQIVTRIREVSKKFTDNRPFQKVA